MSALRCLEAFLKRSVLQVYCRAKRALWPAAITYVRDEFALFVARSHGRNRRGRWPFASSSARSAPTSSAASWLTAFCAAHLVNGILPEVPVRQWVLTLPYPLRYRCAWNSRLTSEVLRLFLLAVFADQRRRAKRDLGICQGLCGAVPFIQRFGSALNLTPHFHTLVLDGVDEGPAHSPRRFHHDVSGRAG